MANVQNGLPVAFGFVGTLTIGSLTNVAATPVTTAGNFYIIQDIDHSNERELDNVRDGTGAVVQRTWFNPEQKATLTYVVSATSSLATALANQVIPDKGTFVSISACAPYPALIFTTWEVHGAKIKKTNTKAAMVTLDLVYNPNISAATSV